MGVVDRVAFGTAQMYSRHMDLNFNRKLAREIALTRGPRSRLTTLKGAAVLIRDLEPFRQARPVWDRAAGLVLLAARPGKRADVAETPRQFCLWRLSARIGGGRPVDGSQCLTIRLSLWLVPAQAPNVDCRPATT